MKITVKLIEETHNSTLSAQYVDGGFFGFVCEDGYRQAKVPGETRIPGGLYKVAKRTAGKFYTNYKRRFKHAFALWILNVPGFEDILMHIGNGPEDSRGCLLVGRTAGWTGKEFYVGESTVQYERLYAAIAAAFDRKEEVWIEVDRTKEVVYLPLKAITAAAV